MLGGVETGHWWFLRLNTIPNRTVELIPKTAIGKDNYVKMEKMKLRNRTCGI